MEDDTTSNGDDDDEDLLPEWYVHNVSYVPDCPANSLRLDHRHDGARCGQPLRQAGGGAYEMANYHPVALPARLPGGFHLSRLPDPRSVRGAMAAPDVEG